ncbi:MAG: DegV family protein [Lachnospiraceae bacterium]|nr:DegV family protein [Lachnospiraceae bacterium]
MATIRIVADSSCDLSAELKERNQIATIPLCIIMEEETYFDGESITPDQIYLWSDVNKLTPKTAAVPYDKAVEVLEPFMKDGDEIIYIGLSEQMSTTCNIIRLIASDYNYDKLHVIDSMSLSTGIGVQLLYAAQLVREGKSVSEIIELVENRRSKVRASFVVETLTYLARGGRCKPVTALLGNTLKLKPQIVVERGAMGVSRKYRGKQSSVILKYVRDLEDSLLHADPTCVFITHSGCEDELLEEVQAYLKSLNHFENIYTTRAGGSISCHCGPGTLGVLFYAD